MIREYPTTRPCCHSTDQAVDTEALVDVSGLGFPLDMDRRYEFRFLVAYHVPATGIGLGLAVQYPPSALFAAKVSIPQAADGSSACFDGWLTASGDVARASGSPAANTTLLAVVVGLIEPSEPGWLRLRARSEQNGSVITIRRGSSGILTTIG